MAEQTTGGYTGKILRVNLTDKKISIDEPDDKFYRQYFGGTALIGYYLVKELKPGIDPLGPDNKLIFSAGVISGIPCSGSGRSGVGAKSPLTNGWGDSQGGGFWPAELKRAGWDAIIIEGKSETPVYLWINDDKVEIRDATHLWGKTTLDVQNQIQEELNDKRIRVSQCGPAGEKLARIAGIANDITHYHGRTGMGAVMGSKMLRAIAVRGHKAVPLVNTEKVREVAKWLSETGKDMMARMTENGTSGGVSTLSGNSMLPTRNFQVGQFEEHDSISGPTMTKTVLSGRDNCYACPIYCKREVTVKEAPYNVDPAYGGPEYESIGALGSCCGVSDFKAIANACQTCNAYGLDTISTGMTIAFAMECFENGILTKEDTGGLELKFGNAEAMMKMTEMIANREGLGDLLAEGSKRAAEKIGKGSEKYAMQIKGQELPLHEPRGKVGLGLGYALSPTGADHMHNMQDPGYAAEGGRGMEKMKALGVLDPVPALELSPAKVRMYQAIVHWQHFQNCAVFCMFQPFSVDNYRDIVNGATGWNTTVYELMKVGERALALAKLFNAREGFTAKDDIIPDRLYEPFTSGPLEGKEIGRDRMKNALQTYYEMAGYDPETAAPKTAKLQELGLGWAVGEMDKAISKK
ncbi:aldehyde ferredoxin oxidoreductase family protein [Chloroflexota bacterium]